PGESAEIRSDPSSPREGIESHQWPLRPPYPPPDTHCPPTGPDQPELHGLIGYRRTRARCGGTLGQHEERIDRDKGTDNGQCNCRNRAVRHVFPVPRKTPDDRLPTGAWCPCGQFPGVRVQSDGGAVGGVLTDAALG